MLIFLDSFDHYSKPQGPRKYTVFSTASTVSIGPSGRTGNSLTATALDMPSKTFGQEYTTMTVGVAYKTQGLSNEIIGFDNTPLAMRAQLVHTGDGRLYFHTTEGDSAPPSTFVVNVNEWYYFEMYDAVSIVQTDSTHYSVTHTLEAHVNEAVVLPTTIISHTYTGTGPVGRGWAGFHLQAPGGGITATVDDVYVTDGEFLGDIKVGVLYPNAVGDFYMWQPVPLVSAGLNWQNVKEHPADDDATIVTATTPGQKDLYNLDDIPAGFVGVIKGVQALWLVKKSDAGSAFFKGVWKSSGTEIVQSQGSNYVAPNGNPPSAIDYLYFHEAERDSLFTSTDWTVSEINALQLGIIRTV